MGKKNYSMGRLKKKKIKTNPKNPKFGGNSGTSD